MKEIRPIILFVDDEELARRTFERMVSKEFRVLLAEDVDHAQKILEEHHQDIGVVLTDQRMPGKLGVDLLVYCREHYSEIVRMLTTAYSELDDAIAAVNRGEILRYIEKPWGNIDGILIDLKLAATIYEIKKENQQLIDEKLSVGFKTSQMEKIRTLITVAASYGGANNLFAVESLLREIAEVPACYQLPEIEDLRHYQMFGQPLGNTICAIELANQMNAPKSEGSAYAGFDGASDFVSKDVVDQLVSQGLNALKQGASVESENNDDSLSISFSAQQGGSSCVTDWLCSHEITQEATSGISALLKLYMLTYKNGGAIQLDISDSGLLNMIQVSFPDKDEHTRENQTSSTYDWIDDLMILFN